MALTKTTLSAAITHDALFFPVASNAGATANKPCLLDHEYCVVVDLVGTTGVNVRSRGDQGTQAAPHNALTSVIFSAGGPEEEWPAHPVGQSGQIPPAFEEHTSLGANGAILVPIENTVFAITKPGVAALTLGAPSKAANGLGLVITSTTAFAHTITATGLLKTGTATVNVGTFAAFAGASLSLRAEDGLWNVVGANAVVLT
jgi:hypothetical protein